jgi:hypothetical protein
MISQTIDAIERNIEKAKAEVEFGAALERLKANKDFKKVVLEGYFEKEAIRLVHLKADCNMQSPEMQRSIVQQMDAIGSFSEFLNVRLQRAGMATKQIEADEETRDEILAEELNRE